jgi:hypothetical protein
MKNIEQDREAFEKWAQDSYLLQECGDGRYASEITQSAWEGWQAASNKAIETLASWMLSRGFSTGHGDTIDDLLTELDGQVHPQPAVPEWIELIEGQPEVDKIAVLYTPLCGPLKGVPLYTRPQPAGKETDK